MRNNPQAVGISRRTFFKQTAGVVVGATAAALLPSAKKAGTAVADPLPLGVENETLTMHADLQRALIKPMEQRKWAMVIDNRRCTACDSCTVACIAENNLPPGVTYRMVGKVETGEYPNLRAYFMPSNCMQCENAPCIEAANKVIPGSMSRRPDGIVVMDYKKMKGKPVFEAASKACPYPKSLWYDEGKNYSDGTPAVQLHEKRAVREYGKLWSRKETKGTTRKCHFCTQRIDAGMLPACVTTCTGQAMHFGDLNDSGSLVSKLLAANKSMRLELTKGAEPRVHYVHDNPEETCMSCHS